MNDVSISKVTHGGRSYVATTAHSHGATETGTKAMGGWNENGAFRACYDRALPVDALLGAAMFNGCKPETYFVARDKLGAHLLSSSQIDRLADAISPEPPAELLTAIFPWIEDDWAALDLRVQQIGRHANDYALRNFLLLLV
jgi:hypothetical protein